MASMIFISFSPLSYESGRRWESNPNKEVMTLLIPLRWCSGALTLNSFPCIISCPLNHGLRSLGDGCLGRRVQAGGLGLLGAGLHDSQASDVGFDFLDGFAGDFIIGGFANLEGAK